MGLTGLVLLPPEVTEKVRVLEFNGTDPEAGGSEPGLRSGIPARPWGRDTLS